MPRDDGGMIEGRHFGQPLLGHRAQNRGHRLVLAETDGACAHTDFVFQPGDIVMVGRESAGVPPEVYAAAEASVHIPMRRDLRSLNVAMATGIVCAEFRRRAARR